MSQEVLLSAGLAVFVGLVYGALLFMTLRRALRETGQQMMVIFFGGMLVRFVVLLLAVGVIVAALPVRASVFLGVLVPLLVVLVTLEVASVMRHTRK